MLAGMGVSVPYSVPQGYFQAFPERMTALAAGNDVPAGLAGVVFSVPEGYFDGLAAQVLNKVKANEKSENELAEFAPVLAGIDRTMPYTVPQGYFENLVARRAAPARVITMRRANKWMQYAAAAMMAGMLVTGAFLFTDNRTNYDQEQDFDVTSELNKVSAHELVTYLNNPEHAIAAPSTTVSAAESDMAYVKDNLSKLSDEELNNYLTENAGPFDSAPEKE